MSSPHAHGRKLSKVHQAVLATVLAGLGPRSSGTQCCPSHFNATNTYLPGHSHGSVETETQGSVERGWGPEWLLLDKAEGAGGAEGTGRIERWGEQRGPGGAEGVGGG